MRGIAFNVTYNDSGANGGLIGYRGVCSDRIIVDNVKHRRMTCCSDAATPCRRYVDAGLKGRRPTVPPEDKRPFCYESVLLSRRTLRFGAGIYHKGSKAGEAIPFDQDRLEEVDIAFLTTIPPEGKQKDRIVFGCYRVGRVIKRSGWGNCIESDGTMDVVVPDDTARGLFSCQLQKKSTYTCVHCTKYGVFGPKQRVAYVHCQ